MNDQEEVRRNGYLLFLCNSSDKNNNDSADLKKGITMIDNMQGFCCFLQNESFSIIDI
jgi:hypothetical protein